MTDDEGQAFFARIEYLEQQLAECQAREKVLRSAFSDLLYAPIEYPDDEYQQNELAGCLNAAREALTMPSDSTALDTLKRQWQREALLEAADWFDSPSFPYGFMVRDSIRRMAKELE